VQGRSEQQAGSTLSRSILTRQLHRASPWERRVEVGWALGRRCSTGSPSTLPCSSSTPQANRRAPYIAVPAAVGTPPMLSQSPRTVDTLWGCGESCCNLCGRGQFSMSAALPSRFAGESRQQLVNPIHQWDTHLALKVDCSRAG
jgi:hypothetical protein